MPVDSLLNLLYVFFGFSRVLWLGYVGYVSVPCVCFSVAGCGRAPCSVGPAPSSGGFLNLPDLCLEHYWAGSNLATTLTFTGCKRVSFVKGLTWS